MSRRLCILLGLLTWSASASADPITLIAIGVEMGFTGTMALVAGAVSSYGLTVGMAALGVYGAIDARRKARAAAAAARASYNASLSDRFVTTLRADPPMRGVYGHAIVGGDIVAIFTTDKQGTRSDGTSYVRADAYKHLVVAFAGHRVQGVMDVMIGGFAMGTLDADGWSQRPAFATTSKVHREVVLMPGATWTAPAAMTVLSALVTLPGDGGTTNGAYTLGSGNTVLTNSSATDVLVATVTYSGVVSTARVSVHLGDPDQAADSYLLSVAPGLWTVADQLRGISYAVITLDLENPAFQGGPPDITFEVLGAFVYDPRANLCPVVSLAGAVAGTPGTMPPGTSLAVPAGMSKQVVGSGIDPDTGLSYLDVRIYGTPSAAGTAVLVFGDATVAPAAAPGQVWSARCKYRFLSLATAHPNARLQLLSFDSSNAGSLESSGASMVQSTSARAADATVSDPGLAATAVKAYFRLALTVTAAVAYDTTIRLMLPMLWRGRVNTWSQLDMTPGDPIAWSQNPALCIRDFLTSGLGMSVPMADIDDASVSVAANACDVPVTMVLDGVSGASKTYTVNGAFTTDESREMVLQTLCEAMAGYAMPGAQWRLQAGSWTVPVMSLNDGLLAGPAEIVQAGAGMDDLFNSVRATYVPMGGAVQADLVYQLPAFVTADGEALWTDLSFPWSENAARVANLCRVFVERARAGLVVRYTAKMHAWPVEVGDRLYVTNAEHGWTDKVFRVTDWAPGAGLTVVLLLQEDDPGIYDLADAQVSDPTPNTDLPNPWVVSELTGVAAASGTGYWLINADGTLNVRTLVSWNLATDGYVAMPGGSIEIAWRRAAIDPPNQWSQIKTPGDSIKEWINGLEHGQVLSIGVTPVNSMGRRGPTTWLSHTVQGKTTPPSDVTGLVYTMEAGGARLRWTPVADRDVTRYEIRRGGTSWATATYAGRVSGDNYLLANLWTATTAVWVKAMDTSDNVSANAATVTVVGSTARPYRMVAKGSADTAGPAAGLLDQRDGSVIMAGGRSYNMVRIRRAAPYDVTFSATYDVFGAGAIGGNTAATLAADLAATGNDSVVAIWTRGDAKVNRLTSNLEAAMYRCGASRAVFGSPQFKAGGAYLLVGIPGCGEGAGSELYNGDTDGATNAWCDQAFAVGPGGFEVSGSSSTPRSLRDFSYTGDLNASAGTVLVPGGACSVAGSTITASAAGTGWGTADCVSADSYTGGAFASAVLAQATESLMFGLNSDPLTDRHYTSIDYAINCDASGNLAAYESGTAYPLGVTCAAGDVLVVAYDGANVRYMQNGTVRRTVAAAAGLKLYFDSAFYRVGNLTSVQFGPMSSVTGIGTNQLASGAATDMVSTALATDSWAYTTPASGFVARTLCVTSYTNNSGAPLTLEISAFAGRTLHTNGPTPVNAASLLGYNINGGGYTGGPRWVEARQAASSSADAIWSESVTDTYVLAAGSTIQAALITQLAAVAVQAGTLTTTGAMVRITVVKR